MAVHKYGSKLVCLVSFVLSVVLAFMEMIGVKTELHHHRVFHFRPVLDQV